MTLLAVIPSRYEPQRLGKLVAQIHPECSVLVLDNGHVPPVRRVPWLNVVDAQGLGLYRMWNLGVAFAVERGYRNVAILNDDIRIREGVLTAMAAALDSDPTIGIAYPSRDGVPHVVNDPDGPYDMTGYAFMFRTSHPIRFDESWEWWCGDTAFERDTLRAGYSVVGVAGQPVEHQSDAERDNWARRPELRAAAERDAKRWAALIGEQDAA